MKIRILPIIIAIFLIISATNFIAFGQEENNNFAEENFNISFSRASIESANEYISLNIDEANTVYMATGKPMLPVYTKTFTFPRGTKITNVECSVSDISSQVIDGKIEPAPAPVALSTLDNTASQNNNQATNEITEDSSVYSSSELFPDKWYSYDIGCGLNDAGEDSIFVNVNSYIARYSPAENTIYSAGNVDIKVEYEEAAIPRLSASEYDLLIITPQKFKIWLLPLYFHKTRYDVPTKIKSVESIYDEYEGVDKPEQIKYFIADAKEQWGIKYVLLVGGLKTYIDAEDRDNRNEGSEAWHVPVRYANIPHRSENGYISDLYYADLYRYDPVEGDVFDDWNANKDNIIGDPYDEMDLYPDVYYGRLPCRNAFEVINQVRRIIKYERPSEKPWFSKMIAVGGHTFKWWQGQPDGEWLCNLSIEYMNGLISESVKLYSSNYYTGKESPEGSLIINVVDEAVEKTTISSDITTFNSDGEAPSAPIITGTITLQVKENYTFNFKSTDPNRDDVSYYILWGDGTSTTTSYYSSGKTISLTHKWYNEGEYTIRAWATDDTGAPRPTPDTIIEEFSKGAGFILFQGHGSASIWDTHWPHTPTSGENWVGPIFVYHMYGLRNRNKLPIAVVGGCHNGIFNVTFVKAITDGNDEDTSTHYTYGIPIRNCFSYKLLNKVTGGAISSTGCTGYGLSWGDPFELSAEMESYFFYKIGMDKVEHLGEAHGGSITKYMNSHDMNTYWSTRAYCITEYQLFGDPSLKIGGY